MYNGLPRWLGGKESACQCRRGRKYEFDLWVGKIPWRRPWQSTPVFLPGDSHGQRSLAGYSPWGRKESDTAEQLTHTGDPVVKNSPSKAGYVNLILGQGIGTPHSWGPLSPRPVTREVWTLQWRSSATKTRENHFWKHFKKTPTLCTPVFIATFFTRARRWKRPSVHWWTDG